MEPRLVRYRISRRGFLGAMAAAGVLVACNDSNSSSSSPAKVADLDMPKLSGAPFTLGVASGDPTADSVILWTRLAPDPLNGGGMPDQDVGLAWDVATDKSFKTMVKSGTATAAPGDAHSVHVDVAGLDPDSWFYYRFRYGDDEVSPTGRTRTFPEPGADVEELRFAVASCQDFENGYYTAYRHMAKDDLDLVLFVGDYIYESGPGEGTVRVHNSAEPMDLDEYRNRYAQYKGDKNLQAAQRNFPWIVTSDDHEVENNYADLTSEDDVPVAEFTERRVAAYKAYWEHQPLRIAAPTDDHIQVYRSADYGNLAKFFVLDGRQYRDEQPCGTNDVGNPCAEADDAARSMLGAEQEEWLTSGLAKSDTTWDILANQTVMAKLSFFGLANLDQWDGYTASRKRVLEATADRNVVVVTGDIHAAGVADLKLDFDDPASAPVATEFVGTSITSNFPAEFQDVVEQATGGVEYIKYRNFRDHGYIRCTATPEDFRADYQMVDSITDPEAGIRTDGSFVVEAGTPGAKAVGVP